MFCIIDIRTEAALHSDTGPLLFPSLSAAWSHLDNLHTVTGKICWYAEKI